MSKNRNESGFRNTKNRDDEFHPHINKATTSRLNRYCKACNINRTRFVEDCINKQLDSLEKEFYLSKSKEELVKLLLDSFDENENQTDRQININDYFSKEG